MFQFNASGPDRVVLRDVQMNLAGRYSCEVSADAPNFHTTVVSVSMQVVRKYKSKIIAIFIFNSLSYYNPGKLAAFSSFL